MEDSDEKHFQPVKNPADFLELAKELDKCDRSLLEQLHALYEGKRFTGAHRRTFDQVRLGERSARKTVAAAVDGNSDEDCEELVMAVGQVTPSESQKTDMLQNIKSQSKSKSTAKRLRTLPMSQSLQTAAEEMARAIGSITTIGIPRPKEQLTEQQLELRAKREQFDVERLELQVKRQQVELRTLELKEQYAAEEAKYAAEQAKMAHELKKAEYELKLAEVRRHLAAANSIADLGQENVPT